MTLLGIDVGTGGTRALVINERGQLISSATEGHEPFVSPRIGWAEQHPADWWRACGVAVRQVLGQAKLRGIQIACIGFSGQMHGAVMLDQRDQVVRPALIWCDQRTEQQSRELTETIGADRILQLTCNPALTNFTLTKLLWVRENEPQHWSQVRSVMLPKDCVRFRLTGERATDMADASGTLLLDVAHRCWAPEVLAAAAIEEKLLPPLYESTEVCGKISAEGAAATRALWCCLICVVVTVVVSLLTKPKLDSELTGLVYGLTDVPREDRVSILHRPVFWAVVVGVVFVILQIIFW